MEDKESTHKVRKEGRLVPSRRGLGCSRLHLSTAAEERGQRTDLLASVTGKVTINLKVPKKERAMPTLRLTLKVSTLSKAGHIEWATDFEPRTAAALRKQMETHLRTMVTSEEYPTLTTESEELLTAATNSTRPEPPQQVGA